MTATERQVRDSRIGRPKTDPVLLLRAAAVAAERRLILAPVTASRFARECPPIPEPWNAEARSLLAGCAPSCHGVRRISANAVRTVTLDD